MAGSETCEDKSCAHLMLTHGHNDCRYEASMNEGKGQYFHRVFFVVVVVLTGSFSNEEVCLAFMLICTPLVCLVSAVAPLCIFS